jgi:hypothetical protein
MTAVRRGTKPSPTPRTCAYCGLDRRAPHVLGQPYCDCRYRPKRKRIDGKKHGCVVSCENVSAQTTLAEFIESVTECFPISSKNPEKKIGTWKWSFSEARDS